MRARCRLFAAPLFLLLPALAVGSDAKPMTAEGMWSAKRVGPPSLSPDGKWVAVEVTTFDIPKDESSSAVWLLSTDGKTQKQLTHSPGKSSGPKWSPDGKSIAFTAKRGTDEGPQVYVISPTGGEARRVSDMPMSPGGLKWGADSKTIYCIAQTWPDTDDAGHKRKEKELKDSKAKAVVIDDAVYRYWDRWITDGKRGHVFAVDVATGKHKNLLFGTGKTLTPLEPSAADYDVSPDGKELCFVADSANDPTGDFNFDLFTLALDRKDPPKNITSDNAASDTSPVYSPDGKGVAFLRQTTKHFYADRVRLMWHSFESGKAQELAPDLDRSVSNPRWAWAHLHVGGTAAMVLFEVEDAGHVRLAGVMNDGKPNYATAGFSDRALDVPFPTQSKIPGAEMAFLRSSFDRPAEVYVGGATDKEPRKISFFNDDLVKTWGVGKVESKTIKGAGGADVQMWVLYPPDFDPKKKWPLIQVVHGGPHNGITTDFSYRWNPQLWAGRGYVVGIVNFHGSSGFGQKFTDSITGDYGTKPLEDILKATDWFEAQPWIDKTRMAAAGGSYGGYMVAYMNGHTDRFKAYICHAGVYSYHSQMASDSIRGRERALGAFPWKDMEKIDKQSAQRYAGNFKTPTLVLHGEKDYRVPVTQGFEYYNTLKQKGVPTRLVYFPDENHWVLKPQNSLVWHREVFAWLDKYIGRGPTP